MTTIQHNSNENRGLWTQHTLPLDSIVHEPSIHFHHAKLSPDGRRVAMLSSALGGQLCVMHLHKNHLIEQITSGMHITAGTEYGGDVLCWSPDSQSVLVCCNHHHSHSSSSSNVTRFAKQTHVNVHTADQDSLSDVSGNVVNLELSSSARYSGAGVSGVFRVSVCDDDDDDAQAVDNSSNAIATGDMDLIHQTHGNTHGAVMRPCISLDGTFVAFVVEELMHDRMALMIGRQGSGSRFNCTRVDTGKQWSFIYDPTFCPSHPTGLIAATVWDKPNMQWDNSRIMLVSQFNSNDKGSDSLQVAYLPRDTAVKAYCTQPKFSPDGKYLSYVSDERGGNMELLLVPTSSLLTDEQPMTPIIISSSRMDRDLEIQTRAWITGTSSYEWLSDDVIVLSRFDHIGVVVEIVQLQHRSGGSSIGQRVTRILPEWSGMFENFCSSRTESSGGTLKFTCSFSNFETVLQNVLVEIKILEDELVDVETYILTNSSTRLPRHIRQQLAPLIPFQYPLSTSLDENDIDEGFAQLCLSREACGGRYTSLDEIVDRFRDTCSLPLFVSVHGGPNGQSADRFTPIVQYFATRGWLVFLPNYRGTYGFGRKYRQALNGHWGEHDVNDTLDGIKYLIDLGIVDVNKIVITGVSAGGSTVVNSMSQHPDMFAAGVTMCGVIDILRFSYGGSHLLEDHYIESLVGRIPQDLERFKNLNPLRHAHKITGPIMILHGTDDTVVPAVHSHELYRCLLRAKKARAVEFVTYDGTRHSMSAHKRTLCDMLLRMDRFFKQKVLLR